MKKRAMPLSDCSVTEIIDTCAKVYKKKETQDAISKYKENIKDITDLYNESMTESFETFTHGEVTDQMKRTQIRLYNYCFRDERAGNYYNLIQDTFHKQCLYCGIGIGKELDHFLPKSEYPLLAISPANLVLSCSDCNENKGTYTPKSNDEVLFHPYFDNFDDIEWLKAFFYLDDGKALVKYGVDSNSLDVKSTKRLSIFLKQLQIDDLYSIQASAELGNINNKHITLLFENGKEELSKSLEVDYNSARIVEKNTWKSALYHSLLDNIDLYCEYLKSCYKTDENKAKMFI